MRRPTRVGLTPFSAMAYPILALFNSRHSYSIGQLVSRRRCLRRLGLSSNPYAWHRYWRPFVQRQLFCPVGDNWVGRFLVMACRRGDRPTTVRTAGHPRAAALAPAGGEGGVAAVALGIEFEDGGVVHPAVDRGHSHRRIGEDLVPLAEGLIAGGDQAASLVALGDQLEQDIGLGLVLS